MSISRWRKWTPNPTSAAGSSAPAVIFEKPPYLEPSKPSKPTFEGFEGSTQGTFQNIEAPDPGADWFRQSRRNLKQLTLKPSKASKSPALVPDSILVESAMCACSERRFPHPPHRAELDAFLKKEPPTAKTGRKGREISRR